MGARRGAGECLGGAGFDGGVEVSQAKDFFGEAEPGGGAFAGEVEGTTQVRAFEEGRKGVRQGLGGGGIAVLVIDHAERFGGVCAGCAQDGVEEAGAAGTVEPGGSGDDVVGAEVADSRFARAFAGAVNGIGGDGVVFVAIAGAVAGEDVVGGDGEEAFAEPSALSRKARSRAVSQASTLVIAAQCTTVSGWKSSKTAARESGRVMSVSGRSATATVCVPTQERCKVRPSIPRPPVIRILIAFILPAVRRCTPRTSLCPCSESHRVGAILANPR